MKEEAEDNRQSTNDQETPESYTVDMRPSSADFKLRQGEKCRSLSHTTSNDIVKLLVWNMDTSERHMANTYNCHHSY